MESNKINKDDMKVIGITGGMASGKTSVAKLVQAMGYPVIYTDDLAKSIMATDEGVKAKLIASFGKEAYIGGELNKVFIAGLVFGDTKENLKALGKLNEITHPPVIEAMIDEVEKLADSGNSIVFVESALVYEAGLDEGFDYVITVAAKDEIRIKRASARSGYSEEHIKRVMSSQMSIEEKIRLADFSIENNGSLQDLTNSVNFIIPIIISLPGKRFGEEPEDEE